MSYLTVPRIAFSGRFQSDVSTVNNDVRHFDNATFEPRFQEPASGQQMNGWWNPRGTGAFRLFDVTVQQAVPAPGQPDPSDPATGLSLGAQVERTAAKMVDLDPQFQMGSSLWGLRLILTDGQTEFMRGDYLAAPFRDIFFGRVNRGRGSGNASAKYTSVLENVTWAAEADRSPTLAALRAAAAANGDRLSVNLMTFGYVTDSTSPDFTFGRLTGSIGTWEAGSPRKFVLGRRFAPVLSGMGFSNRSNIGFFDAAVSDGAVSLDLSNALPLADTSGGMVGLGALHLAVLRAADAVEGGTITPGVTEDASLPLDQIVDLGAIDYTRAGWLLETAGIVDLPLDDAAKGLAGDHPLALVTPDGDKATVRIREAFAGLFLRADDMELRVDAQAGQRVSGTTTLHATQYGAPVEGLPVALTLNPPEPPQPDPSSNIPQIGAPAGSVTLAGSGQTDATGRLEVPMGFTDPGKPRGYIDGQIYKVNYAIDYEGTSDMPLVDQIVIHLRDAYDPPDDPDWDRDIAPILVQYGNLYPIMSHGLFSFSDPKVVGEHARILAFALTRDIADPTHMPATRDMSEGKRQAILNWLAGVKDSQLPADLRTAPQPDLEAALALVPDTAPPTGLHGTKVTAMPETVAEGHDGKTAAMREMLGARIAAESGGK